MNKLPLCVALAAVSISAPAFAASSDSDVFAIVITNNRSHDLERPDLQYADDDGARYHALFRGVAPEDHVFLMTTFDRASAAAYPSLVQHLILDSCNSFFVVNPRRPGGRRWATPKDLVMGFAQRHPEVGLFLSTNAEAEVYEWSEFESGIFSHSKVHVTLHGPSGRSAHFVTVWILLKNEDFRASSRATQEMDNDNNISRTRCGCTGPRCSLARVAQG